MKFMEGLRQNPRHAGEKVWGGKKTMRSTLSVLQQRDKRRYDLQAVCYLSHKRLLYALSV